MQRTLQKVFLRSILWGALFFLIPEVLAFSPEAMTDRQDSALLYDPVDSLGILSPDSTERVSIDTDTLLEANRDVLSDSTTQRGPGYKLAPSPQRATILSAILPGLGQAYNRKYWKIPIIYAAGTGLFYYYLDWSERFQDYRIRYAEAVNRGDPSTITENLKGNRDLYAKYRNYAALGIGILYVANVVDAMTDAYFTEYDISDDLSLKVSPLFAPEPFPNPRRNTMNYGVSLCFQF